MKMFVYKDVTVTKTLLNLLAAAGANEQLSLNIQ
jgi:hypothetical protein